jgi:hypothetical protein
MKLNKMKEITYPIPLYFNYIGTMHSLLGKAISSIQHPKIKVCINAIPKPVPFTKCLNKILAEVDTPCFFFMHYDAEVIDQTIFDKMIELYENSDDTLASVTSCNITDLLVLYDTNRIRTLGGWDEHFKNSYMEMDLRIRIAQAGFVQTIMYDLPCPPEMIHKEASALRNREKEGNISQVYDVTFINDIKRFYSKHPEQEMPDSLLPWVNGEYKFGF